MEQDDPAALTADPPKTISRSLEVSSGGAQASKSL